VIEYLNPFIVVDQYPPLLSRNDPDHIGIGIAEAVKHACDGFAEQAVHELSPISSEQIRTGIFGGHALALMLNTISALVVLQVVLKAVKDSCQIFGLFPVTEGDELEQGVEGQRREWQRRAAFDLCGQRMWHNLAEACHVEHEAFLQLETTIRRDRLAEWKKVHQAPGVMLHSVRQPSPGETEGTQSILECLEVSEALNNDGHVRVLGHPRGASIKKKLGNQSTHDAERDAKLTQTALQVSHDRYQRGLNS
jgi:hypothetical protein